MSELKANNNNNTTITDDIIKPPKNIAKYMSNSNENTKIFYDEKGNIFYLKRKISIANMDHVNDFKLLVYGYIKTFWAKHISNTPVFVIYNYLGKNMYFNVFISDGNRLLNKCRKIYINDNCVFLMDNYDKLYNISNDNSVTQYSGFNDNIALMSNGLQNNTFIYTKDAELYEIKVQNNNNNNALSIEFSYNFDSILSKIYSGSNHCLFLTKNGNVYGYGNNTFGQLTKTCKICNNIGNITLIINTCDIIDINCCRNSSFMLNSNNILRAFGELGNIFDIESNGALNGTVNTVLIKSFDCGQNHLGCLKDNNDIYMYGSNIFGECGSNKYNDMCYTGNKININERIISIKCGSYHNIIKTNNNNYYSFGENKLSELLIDNNLCKVHIPTLISIKYLHKITKSNKLIIDLIPALFTTFIIQEM